MSTNQGIIMIVDDEPDLLRMVELYLKKWKFAVEGFTDPIKAMEQFEKNPAKYSLVLTDIRMPQMTGIEMATRMIKVKKGVKIVLMTAYDVLQNELETDLPIIRREDILRKPFRLMEICTAVKKQLQLATP